LSFLLKKLIRLSFLHTRVTILNMENNPINDSPEEYDPKEKYVRDIIRGARQVVLPRFPKERTHIEQTKKEPIVPSSSKKKDPDKKEKTV
jgi:hypothetical protein